MVAVIHRSVDLISGKKGRSKVQKQHEIAFCKIQLQPDLLLTQVVFGNRQLLTNQTLFHTLKLYKIPPSNRKQIY